MFKGYYLCLMLGIHNGNRQKGYLRDDTFAHKLGHLQCWNFLYLFSIGVGMIWIPIIPITTLCLNICVNTFCVFLKKSNFLYKKTQTCVSFSFQRIGTKSSSQKIWSNLVKKCMKYVANGVASVQKHSFEKNDFEN